ncbi:MAG: hypothetical protein ACK5UI_00260 [Bacteroidota bacterium]|jgi:hypothetical protein
MKLLNQTSIKRFLLFFAIQILTYSTAFSQPKERPKNRYKEPNGTYGAPYTLFDISEYNNDKSTGVKERIKSLVKLIETGSGYIHDNYEFIYWKYINTPNPTAFSKKDNDYDPLAAHAKNKAFIALVGVDPDGVPLPPATMNRLKDEAYSALENMNTDVLNFYYLHKTT